MSDLRVAFPGPCGERWEAMTPLACHRVCAQCDRVVHDLSQYDVGEVETLLRDRPDSCVRASIDASGVIATKPERHGSIRRIVAVMGASASLLISPPVLAREQTGGAITGTAKTFGYKTIVIAKSENGKSYKTKVKPNGRYNIRKIPPGAYTVEFASHCGPKWTVNDVIVGNDAVDLTGRQTNYDFCVIVGLLTIADEKG